MLRFFISLVLFFQKTPILWTFYLSSAAVGIIIGSYVLNNEYVTYCSELLMHTSLQDEMLLYKKALQMFFYNYVSQTFLAIVFCFSTMNLPQFPPKKSLVGILFIFPTIINAALPSTVLTYSPAIVSVITLLVLVCYFLNFLSKLPGLILFYFYALRTFFQTFEGYLLPHLVCVAWRDYNVSYVLQVFGTTRLLKDLVFLIYDDVFTEYLESGSFTLSIEQIQFIFQEILIKSFENFISICGVTSVLCVVIDTFIFKPVQRFLTVPQEEEKTASVIISQVLIILTLQLGVTSLGPKQRLQAITNISMLMGATILHQIHLQICNMLTALSIMRNLSFNRHFRVLIVLLALLGVNLSWMIYLLKKYSFNTWLVPIFLITIKIIMSLIISFIVYVLNWINLYSQKVWYEIYDYIYYLECIKNAVSLILGVFSFLNGIYTFNHTGSLLRAIFLLAHFYYNIWSELVDGWESLIQRQIVANCVKSLVVATENDFQEDEVCAICYEDVSCHITSITLCNHFFHSYCLRKWLSEGRTWFSSERRTCPICDTSILPPVNENEVVRRDRMSIWFRLRNAYYVGILASGIFGMSDVFLTF